MVYPVYGISWRMFYECLRTNILLLLRGMFYKLGLMKYDIMQNLYLIVIILIFFLSGGCIDY